MSLMLAYYIDMRNVAPTVDEKLKEVDQLIQHLNSIEENVMKDFDLPSRAECVLLLLSIEEKRKTMDKMDAKIVRTKKVINEFMTEWEYIQRFGIPSFWSQSSHGLKREASKLRITLKATLQQREKKTKQYTKQKSAAQR